MTAVVCPQLELVPSSKIATSGYTTTRAYRIHHAATIEEAEAAAFAQTPLSIPPNPPHVPERFRTSIELRGSAQHRGSWDAIVEYQSSCSPTDITFAFSTGGGTAHITQSLETLTSVAASGTAPNFQRAIGVTHSNIEGADIPAADPKFSLTRCYGPGVVDEDVYAILVNLTAKVNSVGWRGLGVREVLFLGAEGQSVLYGNDTITFHFAVSKTLYNVPVGNMIMPLKRGHDLLWTRYTPTVDGGSSFQIMVPTACYAERVFEQVAFNDVFSTFGI